MANHQDVETRCKCGEVRGRLRGASPQTVNHMTCYCDDCQAFAHHLGRADLLDEHGGSVIVQVAPRSLTFDRGADRIEGVRLSPKGLYRFYASCCKTPVGNTPGPSIPFIGITDELLRGAADVRFEDVFGRSRAGTLEKFAIGTPSGTSRRDQLRMLAHVLPLLLGWKLRGRGWPHPFFDQKTKEPRAPVSILPATERAPLRARCGPTPTSGGS